MKRKLIKSSVLLSSVLTLISSFTQAQDVDSTRLHGKDSLKVDKVMDEVIITGYGAGKRSGLTVGSIAVVGPRDFENRPSPNVLDALQGKVPGLSVFTSSGEPSVSSSLSIHGVASLGSGSTPLILLDGTQVDQSTILTLNSTDIESFSVLKDASATSIYGARAANGVILITTKKGSASNPSINLLAQTTSSTMAYHKFFGDYLMNTSELLDFWKNSGLRTQAQITASLNYPNASINNNTQWVDVYYKKHTPIQNANLSISGGSEKVTYFISGGAIKDEGIAYRSGYTKYNVRSNVTAKVAKWITAGLNLALAYDKRQSNPYGANSLNRGLGMLAQPFYSPYDSTGQMYTYIPGVNRYNPNYLADKITSASNNIQFNPTAYLQLMPVKGLTLKSQAGMDFYDYRTSSITYPSYLGSLNNGSNGQYFARNVQRTFTNTGEYTFAIKERHNFDFLVGQEFVDYSYENFRAYIKGLANDNLVLLNAGTTYGVNGTDQYQTKGSYAYLSYFSKLSYNLDTKYFLDLSIRQDKSSRFGTNKKTGNFWSVGAMWKIKKEDFLKDATWLDNLDVRLSYGTTGNSDIGNYLNLPLVGTNKYGGNLGYGITQPGNPDLSWEKQGQYSLDITTGFFNRIRFNTQIWDRITTNMLVDVPYPYTTGFSSITQNVGKMEVKGIDVRIDGDVVKTKDLIITPYVNFSYNKQTVKELFQGKSSWVIPNTGVAWVVGQPIEFIYPIWAGVDPKTGNPQWYLPGADQAQTVKDPTKVTNSFSASALQQNTGIKRYPPFYGGWGLNGSYKGFVFSANFSFYSGKYLINNDRYFFENPTQFSSYNQAKNILDYWKNPGDNTRYPSITNQFTQFDSRLIENASFIRLKDISLGYNLPTTLLRKTNVFKGVQVFVIGRNLWTITKYTGPDPEVDSNLTYGVYPNTKQYSVGVNLKF